jgi:hypothetical protein
MTVLLSAVAAVVVLALAISARPAIRAVRERRTKRAGSSSERWDAALRALASASPEYAYYPPVPDPRQLTDEDLCRAWCASYEVVSTATSARRLKVVAQERRSYLDELQRRHPQAVEAWLAGPATADGDPMPYLRRGFGDLHQEDR